jgi:WD40 repeat protein
MRVLILLALAAGSAAAQTTLTESAITATDDINFIAFTYDSETLIAATTSGLEFYAVDSGDAVEVDVSPLFNEQSESRPALPLRVEGFESGAVLRQEETGEVASPRPAAISPDGSLIAFSNVAARTVRVVETGAGQLKFTAPSGLGAVSQVRFSPDNRLLAIAYGDADIHVWNVSDGRLVHVIDELDLMTGSIKFSSDAARLYTGGVDRIIRIWDTRSWREIRRFETQHPETISNLDVSEDEKYVLTSGFDAATVLNPAHVVLWDAEGGEELARIRLPHEPASVSFSPDGRSIAVAEGESSSIRIWAVNY